MVVIIADYRAGSLDATACPWSELKQDGTACQIEPAVPLTCPCRFPPAKVSVRPSEGRTNEASQVYGRADYCGAARA